MKEGDYEQVVRLASQYGTDDNNWLTLRYGVHVRLKQYDLALGCLMKRIELNPLDIEAYNLMGMIELQHNRDLEKARRCFEATLTLSPFNLVAKSGISQIDGKNVT